DNITLLPLPSYSPELNPMENVWDYLRSNKLCGLLWDSYEAIVDACTGAWHFLINDPERIRSIGSRIWAHPGGEQSPVEEWSAIADTFGGRVHVEWDAAEPVTPLGQLPFFVEYLKQGGLFEGWVADCPLSFTSPNAPRKRDVLGTLLLSVLAGHQRYAHITALRCDR